MSSPDKLILELADRMTIQDLIVKYARARDTTDPDLYRQIFAEDAVIAVEDEAVTALTGTNVISKNLEEILAKAATDQIRFNTGKQPGRTSYAIMRHEVCNVTVTISGDSARSDYYIDTLAYNESEKRPEIITTVRAEDEYRRDNGRWWITRSTLIAGWFHEEMRKNLKIGHNTPPEYLRKARPA